MTPTPFPRSSIAEIKRIDDILVLNREMLMDAEAMPEGSDRTAKIAKVKARINAALDERLEWMRIRDLEGAT